MIETPPSSTFFFITSDNCADTKPAFYGYAITDDCLWLPGCESQLEQLNNIYAGGAFCYITKEDNLIFIRQNYLGSFGIYIYKNGNYWAISNSFLYLLEHIVGKYPLSINAEFEHLYISHLHYVPALTETIINEISQIASGEYIVIDIAMKEMTVLQDNINFYTIPPLSEAGIIMLDAWHAKYENLMKFLLKENRSLTIELSGGMDSRAALACGINLDFNMPNLCVASSTHIKHSEDLAIAKQIAASYDLELNKRLISNIEMMPDDEVIMRSLYVKFFGNDEMAYSSHWHVLPEFICGGNGGESVRTYINVDFDEYAKKFLKTPSFKNINFINYSINAWKRSFAEIKARYTERSYDGQKIYTYIRVRDHAGRGAIEKMLHNVYTISPLLDPILRNFDLYDENHKDLDILFALIIDRYLPKLKNLPFNGNRSLDNYALDMVKTINAAYPYKQKNEVIAFKVHGSFDLQEKPRSLGKNSEAQEPRKKMLALYNSDKVKCFIGNHYGKDVYDYACDYLSHAPIWGDTFVTKLLNVYILYNLIYNNRTVPEPEIPKKPVLPYGELLAGLSTARLDIKVSGSEGNRVDIVEYNDLNCKLWYPKWFNTADGQGMVILTKSHEFNSKLKINSDGKLGIVFKGFDLFNSNGNIITSKIDFETIKIFDVKKRNILCEYQNINGITYEYPFTITCPVKNGDLLTLYFKFKVHEYSKLEIDKLLCQYYDLIS